MEEKKEKKQVSLVVVIILGIVVAFAVGYACKMIKNNKAKEEQKVEEKEIQKEEVDEVIPVYFCDSNKNDIYSKLVNYWNNSYLALTSNIEEYKKNSVIKNEPSIDCNRAIKYNEYTDHEISDLCSNKENCIVIPEDDGLSNVIVYDGTNVYEIIENGVDEYSDELNTYYATQTLFELTDLCKTCNGYTLNPKQRLGTKERWNSFVVDVEYSDGNKETFDIDLINKKLNNRK